MLIWRGEKEKEKISELQIYSLLLAHCNTDDNKLGERIKK